ncbi:hypothetical protein [Enterovibrio qingdaonensis]|nr:hypothetical protein [Enterovibrio sp. ZSDZ35]
MLDTDPDNELKAGPASQSDMFVAGRLFRKNAKVKGEQNGCNS